MANITENLLVKRARGNVGKQFIYRTEGLNTHITKMPRVKGRVPKANELEIREQFAAASRYGRSATASLEIGLAYKKKAGSAKRAFGIAFKDYLTPPKVHAINTLEYRGTPGSFVVVKASDDFKVVGVSVSISNDAGELIEEGLAVQDTINTNLWKYTATVNNNTLVGSYIKAVAKDVPGNTGSLEVVL